MFLFQRPPKLRSLIANCVLEKNPNPLTLTRKVKRRKAILHGAIRPWTFLRVLTLPRRQNISSGKVFTWENLNYHVPVSGGQRRLLHDVFGYVKPGSLTALMGASGAGE